MSRRLQIMLPDQEMSEIQRLARRECLSVGEWVRRTLRESRERKPVHDAASKLSAIHLAAEYAFPTGDIEQMLGDIERGGPA